MNCPECHSGDVEINSVFKGVTIKCLTCGRETDVEKTVIGRKDHSVYERAVRIRRGRFVIIEARGLLISTLNVVVGNLLDEGILHCGSTHWFVTGETDGKQVGVLDCLVEVPK